MTTIRAQLLLLLVVPFCVSSAQRRTISPFARVGTGFGTFGMFDAGYDEDASNVTLEVGVLLNPYFGVSAEHMRLAGSSDSGRWSVGTVRLYPVRSAHVVAPWLAGGVGWATADTPDHAGSPHLRQHIRFSGAGLHSAIGLDIRTVPHIFIVPSLAVRWTAGLPKSSRASTLSIQALRLAKPGNPSVISFRLSSSHYPVRCAARSTASALASYRVTQQVLERAFPAEEGIMSMLEGPGGTVLWTASSGRAASKPIKAPGEVPA